MSLEKIIDTNKKENEEKTKKIKKTTKNDIEKILSGEITPKFTVVDYGTEKGQNDLKEVLQEQKKCIQRKEINWKKLNEFRITI